MRNPDFHLRRGIRGRGDWLTPAEVYLPRLRLTNGRDAPGTDSTWWTRRGPPREHRCVEDVDFRDGRYNRS